MQENKQESVQHQYTEGLQQVICQKVPEKRIQAPETKMQQL
jgi:hypothetical protein